MKQCVQQERYHPKNGALLCCANRKKGPCGAFAVTGSKYCKHHGGVRHNRLTTRRNFGVARLPYVYKKYLTKTLQAAVLDATGQNPAEQLQLFDELALVRESIGPIIETYGKLLEARELVQDPEKREKINVALQSAGIVMRDALKEVATMCEMAARVNAAASDKVSVLALHHFVNDIILAAHDMFGNNVEMVYQFEALIKQRVKLPSNEGTVLTPDQDVIDMDSTIPREEE